VCDENRRHRRVHTKIAFSGGNEDKIKSTKESIKKISRLYQITPTNKSLKVLFEKEFTSALEIQEFEIGSYNEIRDSSFTSVQEGQSMRATELSGADRRRLLRRRLRRHGLHLRWWRRHRRHRSREWWH